MANFNNCDPCECGAQQVIGVARDPMSFRQTISIIACQIKALLEAGLPVVVTAGTSSTATQTTVTATGASSSILAANAARKGGWVTNIGASDVYVAFGATATVGQPVLLAPGDSILFNQGGPVYVGVVSAITGGGSVDLEVTELA